MLQPCALLVEELDEVVLVKILVGGGTRRSTGGRAEVEVVVDVLLVEVLVCISCRWYDLPTVCGRCDRWTEAFHLRR